MTRGKGYFCLFIVLAACVIGIFVYRTQGKKWIGYLGKEIVYFGDTSASNETGDGGKVTTAGDRKKGNGDTCTDSDPESNEGTISFHYDKRKNTSL